MLVSHIEWYQREEQQEHELQRSPSWWKKSTVTGTANVHQEKVEEGWKQGEVSVLTAVHIALCPSYPVSFWLCPVRQCIEETDSAPWKERRGESFQQGQPDFITHGLHQPEWYKFSSVAVGRHSPIKVHCWEEWSFIFGTQKNHLASFKNSQVRCTPWTTSDSLAKITIFFFFKSWNNLNMQKNLRTSELIQSILIFNVRLDP